MFVNYKQIVNDEDTGIIISIIISKAMDVIDPE